MRCRNSCAIMSNAMAHSAEARIGGVDVASDADILRRAEGSDEGRLWASLAKAQDAAGFCHAWLDLQCGRTRGATTALILLQGSEGSFGPAAAWPSGPQNHPHLRDVAEQALSRSEEHTSELQSLMRNSYAV